MFKYIVSGGCSFLEGIGCHTSNNSVVHSFRKKFNGELVQLAKSGASNDRTIRKIIDWSVVNKNQLKNTLFLIGITAIHRYESWDELLQGYAQGSSQHGGPYKDNQPYEVHNIDYPHARGSELDLHRGAEDQLLTKVQRMYYKYLQNNKIDLDKTLRNIILLTSFFKKHGSKYLIFNSMGNLKKMSKGHRFFNEVFNDKNYYSDEGWYESLFPKGRGMFAAEDERFGGSNDWGHPSEKSHKLWFEKLYKHGEEIGLWKE